MSTVSYVFYAALVLSCQHSPNCFWLEPGMRYQSNSPTRNPNWCVSNRGYVRSPVRFELRRNKIFLGPNIEQCDPRERAPTS
jgi:hypothetical protein